jgi:glycosyltransferase involved in cell wall biosynthesis
VSKPIILISDDYLPNIGGVATHVHQLAKALGKSGHTVGVIAPRSSRRILGSGFLCKVEENDGVPCIFLDIPATPRGIGRYWWLRRAARGAFAHLGGDVKSTVVHWHDHGYGQYVGKSIPGCVRVSTNHTSGFLQAADRGDLVKLKSLFDGVDGVIAPSAELRDVTVSTGVEPSLVKYIPNGVDCAVFCPDQSERAAVRQRLAIGEHEVVVICARRWVAKNGVIDFAHSLQFLGEQHNSMRVIFAGNDPAFDGSYEAEVLGAIKRSGMMDRCHLLGSVPNSSLRQYYRAADISVLPSLKEATSITGLESMACGLALVGTRIGGIPDLVAEGETGLLVTAGDTRGLAAAISRLVADRALRESQRTQARNRALGHFSWSHIAALTMQTYEDAAARARFRSQKAN